MTPGVLDLIGPMLGSRTRYAHGFVEVVSDDDTRRERFWHEHGRRWRVERDDGLTFVSDEGVGSTTWTFGELTEAGPSLGPGFFAADTLLHPRNALIWGRPGEDWRLSDRTSSAGDGLVRLELDHAEDARWPGHVVVDPVTGWLEEMVLGDWSSVRMLTLDVVAEQGLDLDRLFAVPRWTRP